MGPWDDVSVDADGDELLDWLWDFPERYDVGPVASPSASVPTLSSGVRKHLRRPGGAPADLAIPPPPEPTAFLDDRPTMAADPFSVFEDEEGAEEATPPGGYPAVAGYEPRLRRFTTRDWAAVGIAVLVVVVGVAVGYNLFSGSSKPRPANLAIATPTTTTSAPGLIPPLDTTPSTADTTTSIPPTTLPTSSSVAAALAGASTTTTRAATTTTRKPTTTVPPTTTTTTTTVPPTTTTSSTTAPTTSTSTTSTSSSTTSTTSASVPSG